MLSCYRVELRTTNAMRDCAQVRGRYVDVEDGALHVVAPNVAVVAAAFPDARKIERVGVAHNIEED